jgi:iron-sulfur cluster insertion protein
MKLDQSAVAKLRELLAEENNPYLKFRIFVQGGGCSGMQYGFRFDDEQSEEDFDLEYDSVHVLVDSMSWNYLQNAEIRFREDDMGSSFVIENPNATTTCGCGSSFNPY